MTLVKERIRALGGKITIVLRLEKSLQVRRVVNGMRPGIRSEELEVVCEASLNFQV